MPKYGAGARVRGARERGGPRPRAERTLERGGTRSRGSAPSSGAGPLEGRVAPRAGRNLFEKELSLERGGARSRRSMPSGEAEPARGVFLGGPPWWASEVLLRGPCPAGLVSCMVRLSLH
jgi:hypothetical protein